MVVLAIRSLLYRTVNIRDPLWKYHIKDLLAKLIPFGILIAFTIIIISTFFGTEWIFRTVTSIFNILDAIVELIVFVITQSAWLQATATSILAYLTYKNVKNRESLMEANNEMVDANRRHVEETRKERRREHVKNIILNDIRPLDKELSLH